MPCRAHSAARVVGFSRFSPMGTCDLRPNICYFRPTDFAVRDIHIQCIYYGRGGSEINRHNKIIYDRIEPGKKLRTKEIVFGFINDQSAKAGCEVVGYHNETRVPCSFRSPGATYECVGSDGKMRH